MRIAMIGTGYVGLVSGACFADFGHGVVCFVKVAAKIVNLKNGILPIKVSKEDLDKLMDDASRGANATLSIDLEKQEIRGPDGGCVTFEIDAFRKHCLLNGLDDIGLTMQKKSDIDSFEGKQKASQPWLYETQTA